MKSLLIYYIVYISKDAFFYIPHTVGLYIFNSISFIFNTLNNNNHTIYIYKCLKKDMPEAYNYYENRHHLNVLISVIAIVRNVIVY